MTNFAVIVWIVFIIAGAVFATVHPQATLWAFTALPQNTLLLPGPFVPTPLENRYVVPTAGISANRPVEGELVSAAPVLPLLARDRVLVSVPVEWADVYVGVNAGARSSVCRGNSSLGSVSVAAVRCEEKEGARTCEAILQVPIDPEGLIKELAKPDQLYVAGTCRKGS